MNEYVERVEAWIAALESGEYTQAQGALTRVGDDGTLSHCCLGVACQLYLKAHPEYPVTEIRLSATVNELVLDYGPIEIIDGVDEESDPRHSKDILPEVVQEWYGLTVPDGDTVTWLQSDDDGDHSQSDTLAEVNDSGVEFPEIARLIREQILPGVRERENLA